MIYCNSKHTPGSRNESYFAELGAECGEEFLGELFHISIN